MIGPCPVPNCAERVGRGYLMCLAHWRLVPKAQQREVWRLWRRLVNGRDVASRMAARQEYRTARDAAVEAASRAQVRALPIAPDEPGDLGDSP